MSIAGSLKLKLVVDAERVAAVEIVSTRPRAARLLAGKSVSAALSLLPLLFTVCGGAQRLAGAAAVAAAQGRAQPATEAERLTLLCEATQEHLWRLLLDWPQLLGQAQLQTEFSAWFRRLALAGKSGCWPDWGDTFADFVATEVLGMPLESWEQLASYAPAGDGESLAERLWRALPDAPLEDRGAWLPQASAATFAQALDGRWDEAFERHPEWQGAPAETGALARWRLHPALASALLHYGRGARPRLLARLMDLARCARYIADGADAAAATTIDACSVAPGIGVASVETARGTLLHRVRLEDERVAEYTLVAPTEWNFHPRGAFASLLFGAPGTDGESLRRHASALALALDPCVPYQIEIEHA
ncbi:MAG: nickel-dependent hydrogenase large subunit [Proteobacteria bacterium]|nr:nickel-dependent hydrogenase large subunit [Pseudomonadota bacterium]